MEDKLYMCFVDVGKESVDIGDEEEWRYPIFWLA